MLSLISTHQFCEEGLETQWYDDQHWIKEVCEAGSDGLSRTLVAKAKHEEMGRSARMKVHDVCGPVESPGQSKALWFQEFSEAGHLLERHISPV